jgi:predicted DNA-binding transcriptional regulator YafY
MAKAQRLPTLVEQLRTVERLLISGCTLPTMADTIGVSPRQVQRLMNDLRSLGLEIKSNFIPGNREPTIHKAK